MVILFDPVGSPDKLEEMIVSASLSPGVSGLMILACEANGFTPGKIDPILGRAGIGVFGGVFPALIYGKELVKRGSLVVGLPRFLETRFIPGLSNSAIEYESCLDLKLPALHRPDHDGFCRWVRYQDKCIRRQPV